MKKRFHPRGRKKRVLEGAVGISMNLLVLFLFVFLFVFGCGQASDLGVALKTDLEIQLAVVISSIEHSDEPKAIN